MELTEVLQLLSFLVAYTTLVVLCCQYVDKKKR